MIKILIGCQATPLETNTIIATMENNININLLRWTIYEYTINSLKLVVHILSNIQTVQPVNWVRRSNPIMFFATFIVLFYFFIYIFIYFI